jgi:hypothetical protein
MQDSPRQEPRGGISAGTSVEVRNRFCRSWGPGFQIASGTRAGYRVRRTSDGYLLPVEFASGEVRVAT